MRYAIIDENGIITNIIICESDEIAAQFGALPVREDLGVGEEYAAPIPEPTIEERVAALEEEVAQMSDNSSVWDELDAAYTAGYDEGYQEGVNEAYDQ